MLANSFTCI